MIHFIVLHGYILGGAKEIKLWLSDDFDVKYNGSAISWVNKVNTTSATDMISVAL